MIAIKRSSRLESGGGGLRPSGEIPTRFSLPEEYEVEMSRRLIAGLIAATLLCASVGVTASRAAEAQSTPQPDAYTADFAEYLSFVGGAPLTSEQRRRVADQTVADLRSNAGNVQRIDQTVRDLLPKLKAGDESTIGDRRETWRYKITLVPADNLGRVVVEENDPTVVLDRKHQRIITQRSLEALQRACSWIAGVLGVRGPDPNFVSTERVFFHDHYDRLTNDQQESLAHVERDLPLLVTAYQRAGAATKAQFVKAVKPYVQNQDQLAPLTVVILGGTESAVQKKIIDDSIVLMGQMNNTMLYH